MTSSTVPALTTLSIPVQPCTGGSMLTLPPAELERRLEAHLLIARMIKA